ncbi:tetratricopeptide (TPR) repeat protein [Pseudarthrobacter sp. PvP004]|uniref:tetratricopeptide repeat protein n=1 Tax=Pseudarthrobacter sp. PvP004 TaxID=2817850 RepID=UPI001AE1140A|nr:tetratricopeptide repeat protein [Pseudarthrobacter sp. PvP004]MBP2266276.1 tetratricopeptide (TPR) repeat protein [Pseudarthrobacter sp. PvP004]
MKRKGILPGCLSFLALLLGLATNLASSAIPDEFYLLKDPAAVWTIFAVVSAGFFLVQLLEWRQSRGKPRIVSSAIPREPENLLLREEEAHILELLASPSTFVSLVGAPGIGKTVLAARAAVAVQRNPNWQVIWWIDGSSHAHVERGILSIGRAISGEQASRMTIEMVNGWLASSEQEVLLVVDGVTNYADLKTILPSGKTIRILATGEASAGLPGNRSLPVGPLPMSAAVRLLQENKGTAEEAAELAAKLGRHVLPVTQAAAYMRTRDMTIEKYKMQLADVHAPLHRSFPASTETLDVVSSIKLGIAGLGQPGRNQGTRPIEQQLIDTLMTLGDCAASQSLLAKVCLLPLSDVQSDIEYMERAGLMRAADAESSGASTVAWRTLLLLRGAFLVQSLTGIFAAINRITFDADSRHLLPECVRLLRDLSIAPHLQKLGAWDGVSAASLLKIVDRLYDAGEYKSMIALGTSVLQQTVDSTSVGFGRGEAMKRLAHAYLAAGNGAGAVSLYRKSLKLLLSSHALDSTEVLKTRIELGHALRSSGESGTAIKEFEGVLASLESAPSEALQTDAKAGLGFAHLYAQNYAIAIKLMEEAWIDRQQRLGPNDWSTVAVQTNLGRAYLESGKVKKAMRLLKDAYRRRKKELGDENPHTLVTAFHFGRALRESGSEVKGRRKIAEVAALRTKLLGPGHADTIRAYSELAVVCRQER